MPIVGIDEVQFVVNDGPAAEDFLLRWGLAPVGDAAGKRYECVDGSAVSFSVQADFDPAGSAFQNLAAVIWGVDEQGALEALERDLARDRDIVRAADGTVFLTDALGLKIGLRLSRKRPIAATPALFNTPGAPVRIDQPAVFYDRALPQEISHIVLGVVDHVAGEAFYRERLTSRIGMSAAGPSCGGPPSVRTTISLCSLTARRSSITWPSKSATSMR